MDRDETQQSLVRQAREVVNSVDRHEVPLAAACIVSSVAVGDFTPASDVDMLMVAAEGEGKLEVRRRLLLGRVFEWVVIGKDKLADADAILRDAGLTHDVLTAIILRDDGGWLARVQAEVAARYRRPEGIWVRTQGQLDRMRRAVEAMARHAEAGAILPTQRSHVSVLKAAFGLPRALVNKRCTMTRGLLFCREAARELGWDDYLADVLALFGVQGVDASCVEELQALAEEIVASSGFTPEEKAIRIRHLGGAGWLLDNAGPADAVWPLYFWSSTNAEDAGGQSAEACWRAWSRFAVVLGIDTQEKLRGRAAAAEEFLRKATGRAMEHSR